MAVENAMLTTIDNPWNPFTHYEEWFTWDYTAGYNSPALLARVVVTSDNLSDYDQELDIIRAIDEIVRENVSGMHRKVTPETFN